MNWTEQQLQDYQNRRASIAVLQTKVDTLIENAANGILPPTQRDKKRLQVDSGAKQTKAEIEYGRMLSMEFPGTAIIPWGITLRMQNGHKYTPDYAVLLPDHILLIEVKQRGKDGFRQSSYQRAKVAFDQCRVEFTQFRYGWAEKQGGVWNEKRY